MRRMDDGHGRRAFIVLMNDINASVRSREFFFCKLFSMVDYQLLLVNYQA